MKTFLFLAAVLSFVLLAPPTEAAIDWTDIINSGTTPVKATHMNQARTQIQNNRDDIDDLLSGSIGTWITGAGSDLYYNSGDVGIGTTSPATKLQVAGGAISVGNKFYVGEYSNVDSGPDIRIVQRGLISTENDMFLNIDSTNTTTNSVFQVKKDALTTAGTTLFTVNESGNATATGTVTATAFVGDGSGLTGVPSSADNLGDHTATTTLNLNDKSIDSVRVIRMKDYDDDTGGTDNKYRILARDGAHQFYNGGVVVGGYGDSTWTDLADGYLVVEGRVGIGKTVAAYPLDIVGDARLTGSMAVGPSGTMSTSRVMDVRESFAGDSNYHQIYARGTITGDPTVNRSAYGGEFILENRRGTTTNGDRGYGYGVRGYVYNNAADQKMYYNAGGNFETRNYATSGISNLRGVVGQAFQNATSGTTDYAYAIEGNARGRSSAGATSVIGNARGLTGTVYPYNTNVTNGYGNYGYVATNNSYSGNITTAMGTRGTVNHDSDDGGTMSTAYGGYFNVYKRATAPNIGTTYGVYASGAGGGTNYGVYSAAGKNYFNGNVGIGTTAPSQKLHVAGNSLLAGTVYIGATDTSLLRDTANRIATDDTFYVRAASPNTYLYSTNTYLGNTSGDSIHLRGNQLTWNTGKLTTAGKLGIGTTAPADKLEVAGNIRATGGVPMVRLSETDTTDKNWQLSGRAGDLRFESNNNAFGGASAKMTIENGGFVGIGLTNPADRLHVNGNIKAEGQVRAATYCDANGANCANNPFGNQISVNGVEDIYGAFSAGTPTDTCNGDDTNAYICAASTSQNCTDRISGTTTYACGKDNQNTCTSTTNSKRTIDCKHLQVYGSLSG